MNSSALSKNARNYAPSSQTHLAKLVPPTPKKNQRGTLIHLAGGNL
jgi:hypothetical protein